MNWKKKKLYLRNEKPSSTNDVIFLIIKLTFVLNFSSQDTGCSIVTSCSTSSSEWTWSFTSAPRRTYRPCLRTSPGVAISCRPWAYTETHYPSSGEHLGPALQYFSIQDVKYFKWTLQLLRMNCWCWWNCWEKKREIKLEVVF